VTSDDPDRSEQLDEDAMSDLQQYPPDRPLGAEDRGVTDAADSVAERRRREVPEGQGGGRRGELGHLLDQAGEAGFDDEADAVAEESQDERHRSSGDWSVQDLEEVTSAEEAAMHLTEEPPMGDGDGYVDDED